MRNAARCGDPCCDHHLYSEDRLCSGCEEAYDRETEFQDDENALGKGLILVTGGGGLMSTLAGQYAAGAVFGLGAFLAWVAIRHHMQRRRRARFIAGPRRERARS
jgi:hypothetical protein